MISSWLTFHNITFPRVTGAEPLRPPIKGIDRPGLFALRNLEDMDAIVQWINQKAETDCNSVNKMHGVVAGAGFIGLEMVEQLQNRGMHVTVVEMMPQVLAPLDLEMAAIIQMELVNRGVDVVTGDAIVEFLAAEGDEDKSLVKLRSGKVLPAADITILGLGVRPDTALAKEAGIKCGPRGHIEVDDQCRTSLPNIWAVGDAVEVKNPILPGEKWAVPLAGPANRQGRMVADNIYGKNRSYKGTWAASVVRVFKLVAACVGINEKILKAKGIPYEVVHVHPGSHAGYFPGAKAINFKLVFCPLTGKIYGAQAVGEDGVEKRIDVISTAMQGGLLVEDLAEIELCYSPPVGSAKDPVNIAGMVAQNVVDGLAKFVDWKEFDEAVKQPNVAVLDVRNAGEIHVTGPLTSDAINIPLKELRKRINELPKDKRIIVTCASGQRAYYARRILVQSGFNMVDVLGGAFKTYNTMKNISS